MIDGLFTLVYLGFNTIGNLRTQDEQIECFHNAAAHLAPGGHFLMSSECLRCGSCRPDRPLCRSKSPVDAPASTPRTRSPTC